VSREELQVAPPNETWLPAQSLPTAGRCRRPRSRNGHQGAALSTPSSSPRRYRLSDVIAWENGQFGERHFPPSPPRHGVKRHPNSGT